MKICVLCVGNSLMMDDGVGPYVFDILERDYDFPQEVTVECAGCMSLNMINYVDKYDFMITIDAVDGTGTEPGTVLRYTPEDVARHTTPMASLHDLKLSDLFDAAGLLGFESDGLCLGIQVENGTPSELYQGLTEHVEAAVPLLIETLVAELTRLGYAPTKKAQA